MLQQHPSVISRKSANTRHAMWRQGGGRGCGVRHLMLVEYLTGVYWALCLKKSIKKVRTEHRVSHITLKD